MNTPSHWRIFKKSFNWNLDDVLSGKFWEKYLFLLISEHARIPAERREVKSADYMNLHFMVKRFYDTSVKIIPEAKNIVPEYPK